MSTGPTVLEWGDPIPPPPQGRYRLLELLLEATKEGKLGWFQMSVEYHWGEVSMEKMTPLGTITLKSGNISATIGCPCCVFLCLTDGIDTANLVVSMGDTRYFHEIPRDDERLMELVSVASRGDESEAGEEGVDFAIGCMNRLLGKGGPFFDPDVDMGITMG